MFSLPRKRRMDVDEEGASDDDDWHVGYAEDVDERRADLLRRLDFKTSGPAKPVNPWMTPAGGPMARGAAPGTPRTLLDVDLHQHMDGDDQYLSPVSGGDDGGGGNGGTNTDSPSGRGTTPGCQQREPGGAHRRLSSVSGSAAAAVAAAAQMDQLLQELKRSADASNGGNSDGNCGAILDASRIESESAIEAAAVPAAAVAVHADRKNGGDHGGDDGGPNARLSFVGEDEDGTTAMVAPAQKPTVTRTPTTSPYAALLGTPQGGSSGGGVGARGVGGRGGGGRGRGQLGYAAGGGHVASLPLPSGLGNHHNNNSSSSSSSTHDTYRPAHVSGIGSLLSRPPPPTVTVGSSQKGKKARFAIREPSNLAAAAGISAMAGGNQQHSPLALLQQQQQHQKDALVGTTKSQRANMPLVAAADNGNNNDVADDGADITSESNNTAGNNNRRVLGPSVTATRSHESSTAGGLAAILGCGHLPPPSAAKPPIGSTPMMGRRLSRIAAPSPLSAIKTPGSAAVVATGRSNSATATMTSTPARSEHWQGNPGLAAMPTAAVAEHMTTPQAAASGTPCASNSGAPSLRDLLMPPLPQPSAPASVIHGSGRSGDTISVSPGPARLETRLQSPDAASAVQAQGDAALIDPGQGQMSQRKWQQQPRATPLGEEPPLPQPLQPQRKEEEMIQQQQTKQQQIEQQAQGCDNPLALMGQHSHRQREFLQGLGRPVPPSALGGIRRSGGGGGRGGTAAAAAAAGLQGQLQTALANLKVVFDREAEAAMSCRPQPPPPPPPGSLLMEVLSRTREVHLTKATCRVRQVYDGTVVYGGGSAAAGAGPQARLHAPGLELPQVLSHLHEGQDVNVFLDSKRSDWGIEPGDRFWLLQPYKVLHVRKSGMQEPNGKDDVAGPSSGAVVVPDRGCEAVNGLTSNQVAGSAVGPATGNNNVLAAIQGEGTAALEGKASSTHDLIVLAHLTRRYGSAVPSYMS